MKTLIIILLFTLSCGSTLQAKESQGKILINNINKEVKQLQTNKSPKKLIHILKQYIKLYKFDQSHYAYEMIYPIFLKNRKLFNTALKSLPKQEQVIIKLNILGFQEEQTQGNDF